MPNPGDNKSVPAGAVPAKPAEIRTFANFLETRGPDSEQYVSGLGDPGGRECAENPGPDGRPCACCIRYSRKPGCARNCVRSVGVARTWARHCTLAGVRRRQCKQ